MKKEGINSISEGIKLDNNLYSNLKIAPEFLKIENENFEKDLLNMNEDEINKINQEFSLLKQKQEKEIENLKNELNNLKKENQDIDKYINDDNNNIQLNQQEIDQLKKDIIKEVLTQFEDTIVSKISQLKKDNNEIIDNKFKELEENKIQPQIKQIKDEILNSNQNVKNLYHNKNEDIFGNDKNKVYNKKYNINLKNGKNVKMNVKTSGHKRYISNNLEIDKRNNLRNINQNKDGYYFDLNNFDFNQSGQNINDENINNIHVSKINNINVHNNSNYFQKDNNINRTGLLNQKKNNGGAVKIKNFDNYQQQQQNVGQKKENKINLLSIFNNIFFENKEQSQFKIQKIDENRLNNLRQIYVKYKNNKQEIELLNYFDNFLKSNVFKIFERKNESVYNIYIIKSNIETILDCFGMKRDTYNEFYYPTKNKAIRNRKQSTEAAIKFRQIFNIDEGIIKDEELIKKLDRNNNDINKVFQQLYG